MDFTECKDKIKKLLKEKNCLTRDEILNIVEHDESLADRIYDHLISKERIATQTDTGNLQYALDLEVDQSKIRDVCPVFLSYGRECKGIQLAYRIKKDLNKRGKLGVWIDIEGISVGTDWRKRITDAIRQSKVLLVIITPHAIREKSVCLQEIDFALLYNKEIIPLKQDPDPKVIDLSLIRKHYLDFSKDEDYEVNFQRLLKALNGDRSELIEPIPKIADEDPFDFGREIAVFSKNFTGREWIKEEINEWLRDPDAKQVFLIVGDIGSGKSAIAAWLSKAYPEQAVGIHFCLRNSEKNSPFKFVISITAQLCEKVKGYKELIERMSLSRSTISASDAFRKLIINPICSGGIIIPEKPVFILIDGLDEAKMQTGEQGTILDIIVDQSMFLPPWLRIIATTRPNSHIKDIMINCRRLEMQKKKRYHDDDIRNYLLERFTEPKVQNIIEKSGADREEVIEEIVRQAQGIFLYAVLAVNCLSEGTLLPNNPEDLPPELSGFFIKSFSKIFPDDESYQKIRPILDIVCLAREPLSAEEISNFCGRTARDVRILLEKIEDFLPRNESKKYEAFHISLIEWLKGDLGDCDNYKIEVEEGSRMLADRCYSEYKNGIVSMRQYMLKYITIHLLDAGQEDRLAEILVDPEYFVAMWKKDEYALKANWAQIENRSNLQIVKVYSPILKKPGPKGTDEFIYCLSEFLDDTDHRKEAISLFEYLLNSYIDTDEKCKLPYVLSSAAWSLYLRNDSKVALQLVLLSESFSKILNDSDGLQRAYFYHATINDRSPENNMILFRLQQKICNDLDDNWTRAYWLQLSYGNEGSLFTEIGDTEEAMRLYKLKEVVCQETGIQQGLQWAYGWQASELIKQGKDTKARELLREQERIAESIGYKRGLKYSLATQRDIFLRQNKPRLLKKTEEKLQKIKESGSTTIQDFNFQKTFDHLKESYQRCIYSQLDSGTEDRIKNLGILATIYELEGDIPAAMKLLMEQEEMARGKYPRFFTMSLISHMRILAKNEEYDKALDIFKTIPDNILSYRDHAEIHLLLMDIGKTLLKNDNLDQAAIVFKETWKHYLKNINHLQEILSSQYFRYMSRIIRFPFTELYNTGKFHDSIDMAELVKKIASISGNNDILRNTLAYQGLSFEALGNFKKALSLYDQQARISDTLDSVTGRVWVVGNQGDVLRKLGMLDQAREKYSEQKDIAEKGPSYNWMISALENLGSISNDRGELKKALEFFMEQEALCRKHDAIDLYRPLERQGEIWLRKGDLKRALELFQEMENRLSSWKNDECLARAIGYQSVVLHAQGQVTHSLEFLDKKGMVLSSVIPEEWHKRRMESQDEVHRLAKESEYEYRSLKEDREFFKKISELPEIDPDARFARLFENRVHAVENYLQGLFEYYSKLEQICERTGYQMGLQYAAGNKGVVSMMKGDWGEAVPALSTMEQICKEIIYPYGQQLAYGRQADLKFELGDYELSLDLSIKQETICRNMELREDLGICLGRQALLQYHNGNYSKSLTLFRKMEKLASDLGLLHLQQKSMEGQGFVNQNSDNPAAALSAFLCQEKICRDISDPHLICRALINKKKLYDSMGETGKGESTLQEIHETIRIFE